MPEMSVSESLYGGQFILKFNPVDKYMLFAGFEVCIEKNCDWGLEAQGHSFSLYRLTLSQPITFLPFYSCRKLAYKWVCLHNFAIEYAYAPSTNHLQKI